MGKTYLSKQNTPTKTHESNHELNLSPSRIPSDKLSSGDQSIAFLPNWFVKKPK